MNKVPANTRTSLWIAAAISPVIPHAAALLMSGETAWPMETSIRRGLAADALLLTAAGLTIAAPLAGVMSITSRRTAVRDSLKTFGVSALVFTLFSALLTSAWLAGQPGAGVFVGRFHLTLLAVGLALASWGALCGAWFHEPLDAAACSLIVVLAAAGGILLGGAAVADLPRPFIAALLSASPLVVLTTAAQIDIVHLDLLYQISPLAHFQIDYPAWHLAGVGYAIIALLCLTALALTRRGTLASPTT